MSKGTLKDAVRIGVIAVLFIIALKMLAAKVNVPGLRNVAGMI